MPKPKRWFNPIGTLSQSVLIEGVPRVVGQEWPLGGPQHCYTPALQHLQEGCQVLLLLCGELQAQDEIEELNRVFQGETAAVMKIRRAVFDAHAG